MLLLPDVTADLTVTFGPTLRGLNEHRSRPHQYCRHGSVVGVREPRRRHSVRAQGHTLFGDVLSLFVCASGQTLRHFSRSVRCKQRPRCATSRPSATPCPPARARRTSGPASRRSASTPVATD